jgi:type I restriction enzyme S subunit
MKGNIGILPVLRFPEFRDAGGWEEMTIGQISGTVTAGGTPSTSEKKYWGGNIRWMNSGELNNKKVYEVQGRITEEGLRNSSTKFIPERSVLIGLAGQGKTRGTVAMNMVKLCINQSIAAIFPSDENFYSDFLYHNLDNRYDELRSLSAGGEGRGGLNLQIIKSLGIPLPRLKEQQKIADCLSSIDELVTAQTQKIEALKAHKKGLMQQLFPAEGETVPKRRFSEFKDNWQEGTIDDLAVTVMGNAFKSIDFVENGIQLLRMGNLYQGELQLNRTPVYLPSLFSEEYSKFLINPSDLLMSMTGTVGKKDYGFIVKTPKNCKPLLLNQRVMKIEPKKNCVKEFLLQLIKNESLLDKLYSVPGGTKQANLSAQQLKDLAVTFPKQAEQQKIADCLSSIDDLITAQTQKLAALKAHKKGLMQQLFPVVDLVTE